MLRPKIKAFQEIGFSVNDIAHIFTVRPIIFWRSLDDHIIPRLELLKTLFCNSSDDNEILINAVKKAPGLLSLSAGKELTDVISLLRSYGLSDDQIMTFSIKRTRYLVLGTKVLESILIRVDKLGIPKGSPMFFHGICAFSSSTEANFELKREIYRSYGFTDADILTLARTQPYALTISEAKLKRCLDFFMKIVGYQPSQITSAQVLNLSLEKRVIPRYGVWKGLKEMELQKETNNRVKSINTSFVTCLTYSEPKFFEKVVQPYRDQYPGLCSDYMKVARPVLNASE